MQRPHGCGARLRRGCWKRSHTRLIRIHSIPVASSEREGSQPLVEHQRSLRRRDACHRVERDGRAKHDRDAAQRLSELRTPSRARTTAPAAVAPRRIDSNVETNPPPRKSLAASLTAEASGPSRGERGIRVLVFRIAPRTGVTTAPNLAPSSCSGADGSRVGRVGRARFVCLLVC